MATYIGTEFTGNAKLQGSVIGTEFGGLDRSTSNPAIGSEFFGLTKNVGAVIGTEFTGDLAESTYIPIIICIN